MKLSKRISAAWQVLRSKSVGDPDIAEWFERFVGYGETASKQIVTAERAMRFSAVYACVRVLAETVASLPLHVYRRLPRGKERAGDHPYYELLHSRPNGLMTSFTFRETLMTHLALRGNATFFKEGAPRTVRELVPLPANTEIRVVDGRKRFVGAINGRQYNFDQDQVVHVPGLGYDGISGMSPITAMREAIGLGLAAEHFGATFFGRGTNVGGVITHPLNLKKDTVERLEARFDEKYAGLGKALKILFLDEGMKFEKTSIPPEDAQFIETRKFQVEEIARTFRVPPHMIGSLDRATFSNIEHQSLEFVVHTIRPWLVRFEQAINTQLFTPGEEYFAEFVVDGLLRGDIQSRYQAYATGRQWGWLSADDIRELENQNPLPEGVGNQYLVPMNMIDAGSAAFDPFDSRSSVATAEHRCEHHNTAPVTGEEYRSAPVELRHRARRSVGERRRVTGRFQRRLKRLAEQSLTRELRELRAAAERERSQRSVSEFASWVREYYRDFEQLLVEQFGPAVLQFAETIIAMAEAEVGLDLTDSSGMERFERKYLENLAARWVMESRNQIIAILSEAEEAGTDPWEALDERLALWEDRRTEDFAEDEAIREESAFARALFASVGIAYIMSVSMGDSCPYCSDLDGKIIGVEESFIAAGEEFQPEGAEHPLVPGSDRRHPPYHEHCRCGIAAVR